MLFSSIGNICADASDTPSVCIELQIDNPNMTVNGTVMEIDPGRGTSPVISEGRTLLPARAVAQQMGASVLWNEAGRTVTVSGNADTVVFTLDSCTAVVNGTVQTLDAAPKIIGGRTMIPVRFFAEILGYRVTWDEAKRTVTVTNAALPADVQAPTANLKVHYIDVGQGDSIFIELPNGETMLIDAGPDEYTASSYISSLGYSAITYVVATHPDSDHITGMPAVLNNFAVSKFYMPQKSHTTKTFERMLAALSANGCETCYAYGGLDIFSLPGLSADVFSPNTITSDNNNCSVVIKLTYQDTSFLFMGDAEAKAEQTMINLGCNLDSDVIKIGHHGSSSSSTYAFLERVTPIIAVISVGEGNSYGHPSAELVSMLQNMGVTLFTTEMLGTVVLTSDGTNIYGNKTALPNSYKPTGSGVSSSKASSSSSYAPAQGTQGGGTTPLVSSDSQVVYRTKTGSKYHRDGCSYLKSKIQTTVAAAKAAGLEACSRCNPPA